MNRELKRVSIVVMLMFAALFISTSVIQFGQADALAEDPRNVRTLYASYDAERGPILVQGVPVASSVASGDEFQYLRSYSNGQLYAPITGYFTLNQGTTGVESAMNTFLSGNSDAQFFEKLMNLVTGQSAQGASVELTIDPYVQEEAWKALGEQKGAVIAIDPATGKILALVSKPSFDPNELASHDTGAVIDRYNQLLSDPDDPLINRALGGDLYYPGSTFKLVVTAAALESGDYTGDSAFPNPDRLALPQSSSTIANSGGGLCGGLSSETVTLSQAIQYSCNIPIAELGMALGSQELRSMAEAFGFGQTIEVPMAATPSTFPSTLDDAQTALSSIGQYDVRATPLQMLMVTSAIANDGVLMQPTLVEQVVSPNFSVLEPFEAQEFGRPITGATADAITEMMVSSVANGVAGNARIEGIEVAGKTGTAENAPGEPYTLWFTGFAPADNPQVAVIVVVENGGGQGQDAFGNTVAAPIAKKVMEAVVNR